MVHTQQWTFIEKKLVATIYGTVNQMVILVKSENNSQLRFVKILKISSVPFDKLRFNIL